MGGNHIQGFDDQASSPANPLDLFGRFDADAVSSGVLQVIGRG
jgi:hypothetical protein